MDQAVRGRAVGSSLIPGTLRLPPSADTGAKRLGTAEEVARESWPRLAARTTDCILTVICSEMFTLIEITWRFAIKGPRFQHRNLDDTTEYYKSKMFLEIPSE